ncbi:tetratricopeptide repeat protein [Sphingomonas silueang]|uniref:tetratricopeptide repeat protein n=1 Tax=Sphingomonas silueang TaxID=3156617 RepID=UPI0032B57A40
MTCNPDRSLRALLGGMGLALAAALIAAAGGARPARADAADARRALAQALGAYEAGHWSVARTRARAAVVADPDWGFAQAVLARMHLALGEGVQAEAALDRAVAGGFAPANAHHLRAHARLLQGDARAALAEVRQTAPAYARYGDRIRAEALARSGNVAAGLALLQRIVARRPYDGAAWVALARMRMGAGDTIGAINAAIAAVDAAPDSPDALRLRAETVRTQYGLTAALPWFEAALARDPYAHDTLIEYAATLGDAGQTQAMLGAVRRAMAARPGSAQGYYLQAVLAARAGDTATARSVLQRAGDGMRGVPGALLLAASLDLSEGAPTQAVAALGELVARQPTNITARKLIALALLRADRAREALDYIRPAAERADADSHTLTLAARALERLGDRGGAAVLLDRAALPVRGRSAAFAPDQTRAVLAAAARPHPGDPAVAIPYIRALSAAGDHAAALAAARAVVAANRGASAAQLVLGDALATAGRMGEAARAYQAAAAGRFDEPTMLRLVDARVRAGQRVEASAALSLFLSQNPRNVAALRLMGEWQLAADDMAGAVDTFEQLRELTGNRDAAVLAGLAIGYVGVEQADVAVSFGAAAYALAPTNPLVADAYGRALAAAGNDDAALPVLQMAARLAPGNAVIAGHLADVAG